MTKETQLFCQQFYFLEASSFHADSDFTALNRRFKEGSLDDVLRWSLATFGDKVAQVTSFGPTGMVILDHLIRLKPGLRVVTLDTNFLFAESYAFWEKVQYHYPIQLDVRQPSLTPEQQAQIYGDNLWQTAPDRCCYLRKVLPLQQALQGLEAWITGLRRDQSPTRADLLIINWDARYNLIKINPLAHWTHQQVWDYIREHDVPYNPLHDRGYASIGCTHCTQPTPNPDEERSGRWQGQPKVECGIHL